MMLYEMMDVSSALCSHHFTIQAYINSLCCTTKTNILARLAADCSDPSTAAILGLGALQPAGRGHPSNLCPSAASPFDLPE